MSVFSTQWHRVSGSRPRLSPETTVRRHGLRGETWILLTDREGRRHVRLNAAAWALAGRFDGRATLQALWDAALGREADPPTQDEIIDLLSRLREAGLLETDPAADFDRWLPRLAKIAPEAAAGAARSPLAWRIPLGNPAALLDRLQPLQAVFTPAGFLAWGLAIATLLVLAAQHASELAAHATAFLATPRYALIALAAYAPVKLVHELAHGLAVRRWGGRVPAAGVTLMMLMPVPWVDASAATGFASRAQRVIVGAAGMMAELAIAALALPAWLWLPEGLARDTAFVTLAITGVSTLMFNANPLQRLDGYFILCDALALPNLATRSRHWWVDTLQRRLLGGPADDGAFTAARGERPWLVAYAPLAWFCGVLLAALAVAWLGHVSSVLGGAAALLLGFQAVLRPPWRIARQLRRQALRRAPTALRWRRACGLAVLGALGILLVPLPRHLLVQGVVWPADEAQLRTSEDGFVASTDLADGARVNAGDVILRLSNPALEFKLARQSQRVAALETTLADALPGAEGAGAVPAGEAGDASAALDAARAELERLQARVASLQVRAQADGRVAIGQPADLAGRWFRRGALVGQVLTGALPRVRVAWPQADADTLAGAMADPRGDRPRQVEVRLAGDRLRAWPATLGRDGAGAQRQLPSAALSERHGGPIATDPADKDDLRPLQPVVLVDVALALAGAGTPGPGPAARVGERAWVRVDAGWTPLAWRAMTGLRRAVADRFDPRF